MVLDSRTSLNVNMDDINPKKNESFYLFLPSMLASTTASLVQERIKVARLTLTTRPEFHPATHSTWMQH